VASRLGAGPAAADWFRGGVVAYDERVKFGVLGVTPGPLVTERCAREMAEGVARLLGAEATIGVTGVGGPEPSEGQPAGTVVVTARVRGVEHSRTFQFPGSPETVISATVDRAVDLLAQALLSRFTGTPAS
jgi:nicotinamide-nucleotide amidase